MSLSAVWWCPICEEDVVPAESVSDGQRTHEAGGYEVHGVVAAIRETDANGDFRTYVPNDWAAEVVTAVARGRQWAIDTLRATRASETWARARHHAADYLEAMATEAAIRTTEGGDQPKTGVPAEVHEAARLAAESCYRDRTGLTPQSEQHYVHTYATAAVDAVWPLAFEAGRRQRWEELARGALADIPPDEAPALHRRAVEAAHRVLAAESISEFTAGVAEGRRQAAQAIRDQASGWLRDNPDGETFDALLLAARLAEGKEDDDG